MGKKLKKKVPKQKKTSQKNYDSGRINWGLCKSTSNSESDSELFQNEDELSGMNLLSSDVPTIYPFEGDVSDNETTKYALMGKQEGYQIEAKFKRLTNKIRDQEKLLNIKDGAFKEAATRLKAQRELFKDKYQKLQDEVTSLRNEVIEKNTTIKKLRDRSSNYESLEATTLSLKEELEETKKQNEDLLQAIEK